MPCVPEFNDGIYMHCEYEKDAKKMPCVPEFKYVTCDIKLYKICTVSVKKMPVCQKSIIKMEYAL